MSYHVIEHISTVLIPDLMGLFWIMKRPGTLKQFTGLNPRFDGAFLNYIVLNLGGFKFCLNPRFDGAFLNCKTDIRLEMYDVLIPDLMGLFWIESIPKLRGKEWRLNPRFDGAFLNWITSRLKSRTNRLNPRFDGAFLNLNITLNIGLAVSS